MARLKLSLIPGTFAVVRFPPQEKPPDWFWESPFYSLTKTQDELSLVCDEDCVPKDVMASTAVKCETNWGVFKVEGPLDFGLTGILNKLTTPLAKAGISIFAISTYDTDYILVKKQHVFNAGYCWILEGHAVMGLPETRVPVDGPDAVTSFVADATIQRMMDLLEKKEGVKETFSIVLVTAWKANQELQSAYTNKFLPAVRKCFLESDLATVSKEIPNAYLYPSQHLHVTVATLHAFYRPIPSTASPEVLEQEWTKLVQAASNRKEWPCQPLQLRLQSAQIGARAGILLWEELTGGLDAMRMCVHAEATERHDDLIRTGIDPSSVQIPTIIHSTFLRFHQVPTTPGQEIQQKFQIHVKDVISTLLPEPIVAKDAKLVCERTPYMHIPNDDRHTFGIFPINETK